MRRRTWIGSIRSGPSSFQGPPMDAGGDQQMPVIIREPVEHDDGVWAAKDEEVLSILVVGQAAAEETSLGEAPAKRRPHGCTARAKGPRSGSARFVIPWSRPGSARDGLRLVTDVRVAAGPPATAHRRSGVAIDSTCVSLWRKPGDSRNAFPGGAETDPLRPPRRIVVARSREGRAGPAPASGHNAGRPGGSQQAAIPDRIVLRPARPMI